MDGNMRNYFPFLISLVIVEGALQWLDVGAGTTLLWWIVNGFILILFVNCDEFKSNKLPRIVTFYLIWVLISAIRGVVMAEGYWDYKLLVSNLMFYLMPLCLCFFYYPQNFVKVSSLCLTLLPLYFILLVPFAQPEAIGKMLLMVPPFMLFLFKVPKRIKIFLVISLLLVFVLGSLGARSTIVRFAAAFLFSMIYLFRRFVFTKVNMRIAFVSIFISPLVLLILGFSGVFNIFRLGDDYKGQFQVKDAYVADEQEDLSADTRTLLYIEVLSSAIDEGYILLGHSLARGYKSPSFYYTDLISSSRGERGDCEVAILNVLTHQGLIGVFLYTLIFLLACRNAIFRSNSYFMKLIGFWIAFRWLFSWLEEFTRFDINYIYIWAFIAMCYSSTYLEMTDEEMVDVIKSCFPKWRWKLSQKEDV